jgi:preprotein translocase subunit SecG
MVVLFTILHVVVAVILVLVVLLQTGKRADLAGAFGGGGSQTAFGARGAASVLSRITTWAAVLFMITSLGLSILSSRSSGSGGTVLDEVEIPASSAPAAPETPTPAPADEGAP